MVMFLKCECEMEMEMEIENVHWDVSKFSCPRPSSVVEKQARRAASTDKQPKPEL
jgi:hypothetical protein